jgi:hypothetical protein
MASPLIDTVDSSEVAGGSASIPAASADAPDISEFAADDGGTLAVAHGEHLIGGHLVVHSYTPGPPPVSIFTVALGDSQGKRWEGPVGVYYAGAPLDASPDGVQKGYHFHPGTVSTSIADADQPVDSFLPDGLAYSTTPVIVVNLPEQFAIEDRPDKFHARVKCSWTTDYNEAGAPIGDSYLPNPARVAANRIHRYYSNRYWYDEALAYQKFRDKVHWGDWCRLRDVCAENISWDDGTSVRSIARFECHIFWTEDRVLGDALDEIMQTCGGFWNFDGRQFRFKTVFDTEPVHNFTEENIVPNSFRTTPRDIRNIPNMMIAKFRNFDNPLLKPTSAYVRRDDLIQRLGQIKNVQNFSNMYPSQAQRLLARRMNLEAGIIGAGTPLNATLRGDGSSLHVRPGDYVTVSHPSAKWEYQLCLVLGRELQSAESAADETNFSLQNIDGPLYSDSAHTAIQPYLES